MSEAGLSPPISAATQLSLSVVVPTKNGGPLWREVLTSILGQQQVDFELLVVDSGSTDGTPELAEQYGVRVIHVPPAEFNHGATRDLGVAMTKGDIVVLMTQDSLPADELLFYRMREFFADTQVGGAYARQLARPEANVLTKRNLDLAPTGRLLSEVRGPVSPEVWQTLASWERFALCNFDNVCSAVRRTAWLNNPFGKVNFAEDIAWSKRAILGGWKIAYVATAIVIHSHDRSLRYDFQRTYLTHRVLYRMYGVHTVPDLRTAWRGFLASWRDDARHVWYIEPSRRRKWSLLLRIPLLAALSIAGQYCGARDEAAGRGRDIPGI